MRNLRTNCRSEVSRLFLRRWLQFFSHTVSRSNLRLLGRAGGAAFWPSDTR